MNEQTGEFEQTIESIKEETLKNLGGAAKEAVDIDKLAEEVKDDVLKKEDPNMAYEKFMEGREAINGE
ncbi:hypothetical protein IKG48_01070 [Candidatus Saccharibacteria bacterium]|nr:hypothetical protein [Candidatus Saccharibacteria bacterium]